MSKCKTMATLSYGISKPEDLLEKLEFDWDYLEPLLVKMNQDGEFDDEKKLSFLTFNFILTLGVLREWIKKYYADSIDENFKKTLESKDEFIEGFPIETLSWVSDKSKIRNPKYDLRKQIINCLDICHSVYTASKHFHWKRRSKVSAIDNEPRIKGLYQYFFTEIGPGIYVEYKNIYYSIQQIRAILIQFYQGLIPYLEKKRAAET